jgi:hypothetical protein
MGPSGKTNTLIGPDRQAVTSRFVPGRNDTCAKVGEAEVSTHPALVLGSLGSLYLASGTGPTTGNPVARRLILLGADAVH